MTPAEAELYDILSDGDRQKRMLNGAQWLQRWMERVSATVQLEPEVAATRGDKAGIVTRARDAARRELGLHLARHHADFIARTPDTTTLSAVVMRLTPRRDK